MQIQTQDQPQQVSQDPTQDQTSIKAEVDTPFDDDQLFQSPEIRSEVLEKINRTLGQNLQLGQAQEVDIVDANNVLRRSSGVFIPTHSGQENDGGGGYIMVKGSNRMYHITGTGKNDSYIEAHCVDLQSGQISKDLSGSPKIHLRNTAQAVAILDLTDTNGDGAYERRGFNGKYYPQLEHNGTASVLFTGGTHNGVKDSRGNLVRAFKAQTLMYGRWNLKETTRKTVGLEEQRKNNIAITHSVSTKIQKNRQGSVHTDDSGQDTQTGGSGMYFSDGSMTRHADKPENEKWREHTETRYEEIGELEVPLGNDLENVNKRRAVSVPTYSEETLDDGSIQTAYTCQRNYGGRRGLLHLVDTANKRVLPDIVRQAYEAARDESDGTLIANTWMETKNADGSPCKLMVRSDLSVIRELSNGNGPSHQVAIVPILSEEGATAGQVIRWEVRTMRPGGEGEVDYVETDSSKQDRRIRGRKEKNTLAALGAASMLLEQNKPSCFFAIPGVKTDDDSKVRAESSGAVAVEHKGEYGFALTRRFVDSQTKEQVEGALFLRENDYLASPRTNDSDRWLVKQAYDSLKKGTQIEESIPVDDKKQYVGQVQLRSDGSLLFQTKQGAETAVILRPLFENGKVYWDKVPVFLHPDGRYYRGKP